MRMTVCRALVLGLVVAGLALPAVAPPAGAQQPKSSQQQQPPQRPEFAISVEVPIVNVDVVVVDNNGNLIPGLKKENFRVLVDKEPQKITNFAPTEAPITIVMLIEFSRLFWNTYFYELPSDNTTYWAYQFLNHLNKDDWVALVSFDLKTRIEVDFTRNKLEMSEHLRRLYMSPPGFSEANLFDAVLETLDRLQDVKGKKSILLLATGFDTFSKNNLDQTLKRLRQSDVTIFAVGAAESTMERLEMYGAVSGPSRVGYLQAKNQLTSFARMTGGRAWFPMFQGQLPSIFTEVAAMLRNQYSLAFAPPDKTRDGKYHKIKVEVVAPDGGPLTVVDQRGKKVKYQIFAREGYVVQKAVVAD